MKTLQILKLLINRKLKKVHQTSFEQLKARKLSKYHLNNWKFSSQKIVIPSSKAQKFIVWNLSSKLQKFKINQELRNSTNIFWKIESSVTKKTLLHLQKLRNLSHRKLRNQKCRYFNIESSYIKYHQTSFEQSIVQKPGSLIIESSQT